MNGERSLGVTTWTLPVRGVEALRWAGDHGLRLVHLDRYDAEMCSRSGLLCEVARGLGVKLAALGMRELERCGTEDSSRARQVIDADIDLACELGVEYVWLLPSTRRKSATANCTFSGCGTALVCIEPRELP